MDAKRCPLCGGPNECAAESAAPGCPIADCWCFRTAVPRELVEQVPDAARGQACICRKCVETLLAGKPGV